MTNFRIAFLMYVNSVIKFHPFFLLECNFSSLQIKDQSFFDVLLPELKDFKPAEVSATIKETLFSDYSQICKVIFIVPCVFSQIK